MRSNVITVMRKEFARFFTDRRMVLTTLLMPGIMIYLLYSLMGQGMASQFGGDSQMEVCVQNLPESIGALAAQGGGIAFSEVSGEQERKQALNDLAEGEGYDLVAVFPEGFEAQVASYDISTGEAAPAVELYYNSSVTDSKSAYMAFGEILDAYESAIANKFDINPGDGVYDLATEEDLSVQMFSMMVPMLMMVFLFSGCMAIAPESIAGEKERGTIATMLITPIRRSHIAVGKILALAVISLVSAASSTIGTILALPKMMGMEGAGVEMNASIYGIQDYLLLAAVIASTVLLLVTLISILSAFAKTTKEAQTYVVPVMILVMVLGVTGMFGGGASQDLVSYLIPLYNSVQCMTGVFSFSTLTSGVLVTLAVNGACTIAGVAVLAVMFNNEKIIFSR